MNSKKREEALNHRIIASQKAKTMESNGSEFEKTNQQLKGIRIQITKNLYDLYREVYMLNVFFKQKYDSLRRDAKWFTREEIVRDCSYRGGCYSRECGYCSKRHLLKETKGNGHCTTEC